MNPLWVGARKGYADTAFGEIHYRHVAGAGAPVVLLHRTPVSSECFDKMLCLLAGKRRTIAFDTPGFGQSFRPSGHPSTTDYAQHFLAALDALEVGEVHLCAHHTGTHFAVEMAVLAADRVRSLLLNGVLYASAAERVALRTAIGNALPLDAAGTNLMATWELLRGLYTTFDPGILLAELRGALDSMQGRDQAFSAILSQDFAAQLSRVRCPVAIVQAIDDPLAAMLDRVREAHPHISVDIIGPAQTAAPERQSQSFAAALLRFAALHDVARA